MKPLLSPDHALMYCPNCAEPIARVAVTCPKCNQKTQAPGRWPAIKIVLAGFLSGVLITAMISMAIVLANIVYR